MIQKKSLSKGISIIKKKTLIQDRLYLLNVDLSHLQKAKKNNKKNKKLDFLW